MWNSSEKFNREALLWDENPRRRELAIAVASAITAAVHPQKNMNAMEFGCGTGLVTLDIAQRVKMLSAVDTSMEMLAVLREKIRLSGIENIEPICHDFSIPSNSPDDEKKFELIYSSMTLHHIDDTATFLARISGLLAPGGIIALADLDREDGSFHDDPLEKVHHGFDSHELSAQIGAAGLQVMSFETIYTMEKPDRAGTMASYPVFLVTARKNSVPSL